MKKVVRLLSIVLILLFVTGCSIGEEANNVLQYNEVTKEVEKSISICDGIDITSDCFVDGIEYSIYKYYPEEEEVTYTKEIVGYCTLCNDGTRFPTCATGRGACSHHGGVAEFNAPIYKDVAHETTKIVIDSERVPERWEIIKK